MGAGENSKQIRNQDHKKILRRKLELKASSDGYEKAILNKFISRGFLNKSIFETDSEGHGGSTTCGRKCKRHAPVWEACWCVL